MHISIPDRPAVFSLCSCKHYIKVGGRYKSVKILQQYGFKMHKDNTWVCFDTVKKGTLSP